MNNLPYIDYLVPYQEYDYEIYQLIFPRKKVGNLISLNEAQYDIQYSKVQQIRREIGQYENELEQTKNYNFEPLKKGFDNLLKSAKKLALGIIGVRTAYNFIRKMASSYLADNEKTANRINNLWTGLGVLMGSIIEKLVTLLKKAVTAILYFASVLTNVNYIAKANEALLRKQAKATANLRKEQNKLNASFDEAEVLQDNSSGSEGIGSVGSVELFDVKELGDAQKIIKNLAEELRPVWEIIKGIVDFSLEHPGTIMTILGGVALIKFLKTIIGIAGSGMAVGTGLAGILGALTALLAIGTIVIAIKIKNESDEFDGTLEGIREQGKTLHDEFLESETDINKIIDNSNVKRKSGLDLINQQNWLLGLFTDKTLKEVLNTIKEISAEASQNIEKEIELYNAGEKNSETQKKILDEIYEQYQYNLQVIDTLKQRGQDTKEIEKLNKGLIQNYKDMGGQIKEANGKMTLLKQNSKVTVDMDLNTKKAEKKAKSFWDTFTDPIETLIKGIKSMFGGKGLTYGLGGRAKGGIYYPKLALGGIINQPGRGVPYHGATIGERGAEAVVPLTDSQQMQLLGEAIGKYITINANIVNTMNGRIISKELQKVQNETNFAINR